MSRKVFIPDLDDFIQRYQAGASIRQLAEESGYTEKVLFKRFTEAGVRKKGRALSGWDGIVAAYLAGESLKSISSRTGIPRTMLGPRLSKSGIPIRGRSEAERLKWAEIKKSPELVARQIGACHAAVAGAMKSESSMISRAITAYRRGLRVGRCELEIIMRLELLYGIKGESQFPAGRYNLDIAFPESSIAVEIQSCATFTGRNSLMPKRIEYIANLGWTILIVWISSGNVANVPGICDGIHAFFEVASLDKSSVGKYGVIDRDGKPFPTSSCYYPNLSRVEHF